MTRKLQPLTPRNLARQLCPPFLWDGMKSLSKSYKRSWQKRNAKSQGNGQALDIYWDPEMASVLDTWGENNVWKEIQLLFVARTGTVLDIACGTGKVIEILSPFPIDVHGCDISPVLLSKALSRGIPQSHLTECDATKLPYQLNQFDFAYSIGSLEHFTEEGIQKFLTECKRVTRTMSFHNIPVSRSGKDEGWISPYQSYFNNSTNWWLERFRPAFGSVHVVDSTWEDDISEGKWFVCINDA